MRLDQALARIQQTGQTVMRTADVMGLLDVNKDHASQILSRLAGSGHLLRLKRETWLIARTRDPLPLVGYLTAPLPSYISLQTALYHHGMISQMSTVTYCVSLARTRVYATPVGTFSVHHISAPFFCAYEQHGVKGVQMATPEKALLDFLYLSSTKTRLFARVAGIGSFRWLQHQERRKTPAPHPVTTPSHHGGTESSLCHEILRRGVNMCCPGSPGPIIRNTGKAIDGRADRRFNAERGRRQPDLRRGVHLPDAGPARRPPADRQDYRPGGAVARS